MTQPRLLGGRYELDGVVGRGGMAEVYRARDIRLDRVVAVKTLREDLARDQTFQARFRREAQSAASLNHPSVVAVYDTGEDSTSTSHIPYIVMEYVDGRTLRDLLRDDRRLLPERAMEITDGVLRALDYSHSHGIVHRDIKPGNVMLTRSGQVKVMDFGIARAVSDAQATMTQTAQVIGTAQYLSPEQARGERVDARSDLYSTGCLLYELLTGRPPFLGDSPVAIAYQHVRENPIPPSQLDPEVPPWADAIVLRAMAKDPRERYQSAAQMRGDIQRALSGMPVSGPRTAAYGATQRMGSATAMAASPTRSIPDYQYGPPEDRYPPDGPKRGRHTALWWTLGLLLVVAVVAVVAYLILHGGSSGKAVPPVDNLKLSSAEKAISKAGLKFTVKQEPSTTVHKGFVISTSPANGKIVPAGRTVTINESTGPKKVAVPDLHGMSQDEATSKLQALGLQPVPRTAARSTAPQGTVVRQKPRPGTLELPNGKVIIFVSGGGVRVPSVIGDPVRTAKQILRHDGLNPVVRIAQGPAGTLPGMVFNETPSGGVVAQGASITIYVQPQSSPTPTPSPTPTSPLPSTPTPTAPTSTTPPPGGLGARLGLG